MTNMTSQMNDKANELKQCPYCEATKCAMDEPCEGCETLAEYNRNFVPFYFYFINNELKPCPFCGSQPERVDSIEWGNYGVIMYFVECLNCKCHVNVCTPDYDTKQDAINAWNTRKGE